jgi:hypothetical protein
MQVESGSFESFDASTLVFADSIFVLTGVYYHLPRVRTVWFFLGGYFKCFTPWFTNGTTFQEFRRVHHSCHLPRFQTRVRQSLRVYHQQQVLRVRM